VSVGTVHWRKAHFESKFSDLLKRQKEEREERRGSRRSLSVTEAGRVAVKGMGADQKKVDPADGSDFQSRHSGPRDPTPGNAAGGSEQGSSEGGDQMTLDTVMSGGKKDLGTETTNTAPGTEKSNISSAQRTDDEIFRPRERSVDPNRIHVKHYVPSPPREEKGHHRVLSFVGVGAHPSSSAYRLPHSSGLVNRGEKKLHDAKDDVKEGLGLDTSKFPSYLTRRTTGRNAQFFGLSREEREHLGGVEYRAITLLAYVVPIYFVAWQFLGCIGLGAYMAHNKADVATGNGINPWFVSFSFRERISLTVDRWNGIFNGVSAFNNSGMSLLDQNMVGTFTSIRNHLTDTHRFHSKIRHTLS